MQEGLPRVIVLTMRTNNSSIFSTAKYPVLGLIVEAVDVGVEEAGYCR